MAHFQDDGLRNMPRRPTQGTAHGTTNRSQHVFRPKPPHDDRDVFGFGNFSHPGDHFVSPDQASGFCPPPPNWVDSAESPLPIEYSHGARSQFPNYPYQYHYSANDRPDLTSNGYYSHYPSPHPPPHHGTPREPYSPSTLYPFATAGAQLYRTPHASTVTDETTDRMPSGHSPPEETRWYDETTPGSYGGSYDYVPRDYYPRDYSPRDYTPRDYSDRGYPSPPHGCPPPSQVQAPPERISTPRPDTIFDLRSSDVLCGRGAPTQYHEGNHVFRQLVAKYQSRYLASRRSDKPEIAMKIVHIVQSRGGRFLKRTKSPGRFGWKEIGEQRAYEKACQALRENAPELRRRLAAQEVAAVSDDSLRLNMDGARAAGRNPGSVGEMRR